MIVIFFLVGVPQLSWPNFFFWQFGYRTFFIVNYTECSFLFLSIGNLGRRQYYLQTHTYSRPRVTLRNVSFLNVIRNAFLDDMFEQLFDFLYFWKCVGKFLLPLWLYGPTTTSQFFGGSGIDIATFFPYRNLFCGIFITHSKLCLILPCGNFFRSTVCIFSSSNSIVF